MSAEADFFSEGHDLDEKRLRQLAEPVADICRDFLSRIRT